MTRNALVPACIFRNVTFFQIIFIITLLNAVTAVAQTQSAIVFRGPTVYDSGGSLGWTAAVADLRGNGKATYSSSTILEEIEETHNS